ncbi:MAG: Fe-S cluster assembly ATPase SufC [Pelagibacterales bacterium]|nr:Fe-S cluster assembly ATPase SufC [Pelagibacterales bacterium]
MIMLDIKNLNVSVEEKQILKNLSLNVGKGEVHAIMGPNGSGKSTIAHTLAGNPNYEIISGNVNFNEKDLLEMDPSERSLSGLFLAFQYPIELPGVTNASYLKQIVNVHRKHRGENLIEAGDFLKLLNDKSARLNIPMDMHSRFVNAGFSGGEKKKNEVLQLDLLNPKLVIMDETDSGLDVDALKSTSEAVNQLRSSDRSFIIITHYLRLLEYIEPDFVHVFQNGSIIESGDKSLANRIDKEGYA